MKTLNFKIVSAFMVVVLMSGFIGCKKDAALSRKDLLTSRNWKISSVKINGIETIDECSKDDVLKFGSDGTVRFDPGSVKCYEDEMVSFGWYRLSDDEKTMSIIDNGVTQGVTIVELTESRMVLSMKEGDIVMEETFLGF